MRRTYWYSGRADGGVDVVSRGPAGRLWRLVRVAWAVLFILAAIICVVHGQWGPGGLSLLVGAIVMPTRRT